MDSKVIGGVLTTLGVLGALLGLYLFELAANPPQTKRLIFALVLGVIFIAGGLFMAFRPARSS
jgi:uncharacterized membrane protein HdeD (DUF308 family)